MKISEIDKKLEKHMVIQVVKEIFVLPGRIVEKIAFFRDRKKSRQEIILKDISDILSLERYKQLCPDCKRIIDEQVFEKYIEMVMGLRYFFSFLIWFLIIVWIF